ncbi:hypothetical protein [Niastella sp. OAS944]|uniref:hypothetical protein n=1 Tax=Niastella sp. OAS944 TaxID=2664089 RepID=UPI00347BCE63|nr:hypothetical protein [Chitinophagaceae bacterium OAS944]
MKDEKAKIEFQFPPSLDPTRDKYDPELDELRAKMEENPKHIARANEILDKYPVPQWILDL